MASDAQRASIILRGHEERIRQLEQNDQPDLPANLVEAIDDDTRIWEDVTTTVTETTTTKWDSADWAGTNDATTDMNWS